MVTIPAEGSIQIQGSGTHSRWLPSVDADAMVETRGQREVICHDQDDQVVVVQAGITLRELNEFLAPTLQCIPLIPCIDSLNDATIGGLLSVNLPHFLEAQCGTWRHWVIGMTMQKPDGITAKSGSKAVKSVAGYDVHKMFIGARGTLGLVTEVILRTYPTRALPSVVREVKGQGATECRHIHRVLQSDLDEILEVTPNALVDRPTATVFTDVPPKQRFAGDWLIDATTFPSEHPLKKLMETTKRAFDPDGRMNPGIMGGF